MNIVNGISRRRFLQVFGGGVLGAALLAKLNGCSKVKNTPIQFERVDADSYGSLANRTWDKYKFAITDLSDPGKKAEVLVHFAEVKDFSFVSPDGTKEYGYRGWNLGTQMPFKHLFFKDLPVNEKDSPISKKNDHEECAVKVTYVDGRTIYVGLRMTFPEK